MRSRLSASFFKTLFFSLLLCVGGGWLAGWVTESGIKEWYPHLIKPAGTPHHLVFPIVWTLLYSMMALSLTLLWASKSKNKQRAYFFFSIQLFLNFIWSFFFFYLHSPGIALIDLVLLWIMILFTILSFWKHTRVGSYLFIPYLLWVSYAFYLNLFIYKMN